MRNTTLMSLEKFSVILMDLIGLLMCLILLVDVFD